MGRDRPCTTLGLLLAVALSTSACRDRLASQPVVLFDEAHAQRFVVGQQGQLDLSALSSVFQEQGLQIRTGRDPINEGTLSGVDALVISGPFAPLAPAEIAAALQFVERGGRLCVMLHIGPPVAELLQRLHVSISNGVIREQENLIDTDPLNFHVTRLTPHPLTQTLDRFDTFGAWALLNTADNVAAIAQTSPSAWVDLNRNQVLDGKDAVQSFAVIVAGRLGQGRFAVFGDDAIFQNQFLVGGNAVLAKNLARFLKAAS
jgi:hypothetical protein